MKKRREFRHDYISINKKDIFNCGDIAIILEESKPNIKIKVNEKPYVLPYRDFIIVTKYLV